MPVAATKNAETTMIESIEFTNFKALRKTTLALAPFTLLLGPNGSGKTSVLQALGGIAASAAARVGVQRQGGIAWGSMRSVTAPDPNAVVEIKLRLRLKKLLVVGTFQWPPTGQAIVQFNHEDGTALKPPDAAPVQQWLGRMQIFTLDFSAIAQPVAVTPGVSLQPNGAGLAAVLDDLRDNHPERWTSLLTEMCAWLPEYDYIQFDKPQPGSKSIKLRTKKGGHQIPARELSQGTLVALALLTLAYLPDPPSLVGLEEIDRGLHPRLLRRLQDALYRLSYPEKLRGDAPAHPGHRHDALALPARHVQGTPGRGSAGKERRPGGGDETSDGHRALPRHPGGLAAQRGVVQRRPGRCVGETMKIGFFSESPADQAALAVFTEGILGEPPEPILNMDLQAHGATSVLSALDGVVRGVHYNSDAEGLVVVVDCDDTELHDLTHDAPGGGEHCRLCQIRKIIAQARKRVSATTSRTPDCSHGDRCQYVPNSLVQSWNPRLGSR